MSASDSIGLLLIAHGTRSAAGVQQFLELARSLRERLAPLPVEPAFLELAKPDIDDAVERLLARGITRLVTVPLLLFAAGHIKRDIPAAVAAALARRGKNHIAQVQADHLGYHGAIIELSRRRMEEILVPRLLPGNALPGGSRLREPHGDEGLAAQRGGASGYCGPREDPGTENAGVPPFPPSLRLSVSPSLSSCLLLVARGSRDDSATAEMYDFARLREQDLVPREDPGTEVQSKVGTAHPTANVEVAFLAMARPLLGEKLAEVAAKRYSRVMVQPHFLFEGELVESIGTQVAAIASKYPETDWLVAPPLADRAGFVTSGTPLLQKVIFDRLRAAGIHVVAHAGDD